MNYLLDTHSFLWTLFSPDLLSEKASKIITDTGDDILVSLITFWVISLKYNIGKLELTHVVPEELPDMARESGFAIFPLNEYDVSSFYKLPRDIHKEPFDRLLIWQAISNNLTAISRDQRFREYQSYGLKVVW